MVDPWRGIVKNFLIASFLIPFRLCVKSFFGKNREEILRENEGQD
jgi:hypothetical protein